MGDANGSIHEQRLGHYFLFVLVIATMASIIYILLPFIHGIILAIALYLLFSPLHNRILRTIGQERRKLASMLSCATIVCLVVIPLFLLTAAIVAEGARSFNTIAKWAQEGGLNKLSEVKIISIIQHYIHQYLGFIDFSKFDLHGSILSVSKQTGQFLLAQSSNILGNLTSIIVTFFLMIFILYYLFKDGQAMGENLIHLIPLSRSQIRRLSDNIRDLTRVTLKGNLITALAQGLAGAIALAIAGLPALFWGAVMAFSSLIPVVGTALIWVPAAIYLAFSASLGITLFFVLWNIIVVGSIDNFLRPYLIGGQTGLSPVFLFLAILGGITVFGFVGLLYGPLIFGLFGVLLYLYKIEYEEYLDELDEQ